MRTVLRVVVTIVVVLAVVGGGTAGYSAWTGRAQGSPQAVDLSTVTISDTLAGKRILAFGEATHGNHEFQQVRLQLSQQLTRRGFQTIAFEADYASTWAANEWVNLQPGRVTTAEEAASVLGFAVYRTRETADWLAWLRAENEQRQPDQRIQLVGIDFQRPDAARLMLDQGVRAVNPAQADQLAGDLAPYTEDWLERADPAGLTRCAETARTWHARLAGQPALAQAALTIAQMCGAQAAGDGYSRLRDRSMFDNLNWLLDTTQAQHVLLFAHSGHVEKTGSGFTFDPGMVSLGKAVAERYRDQYAVIGSDFHRTSVRAGSSRGRQVFEITNRTPLRGIFAQTSVGYLDFAGADEVNRALLGQAQPVGSLGDQVGWLNIWVQAYHSVSLVPVEAFDALVLVGSATPSTPL
ncbi:MAG: erythromycin esterase family protein [Actinomycetia bacterium]|nr:erythromycin esterase family protein [Actinomycetes bacterium]